MIHKRKFLNAIITPVLIAVLAVIAFALPSNTSIADAASGSTVSGTVTAPDGSGIENVSVTATDPGTSTVELGPVTTQADGSYTLNNVPTGTYDFHFDPNGSNYSSVTEKNILIMGNKTINVQITPVVHTHTFSGTLTDSNNNPIAGAQIYLVNSSESG
jgi:protocatechuate 3,4-dioxygenase beta subunit